MTSHAGITSSDGGTSPSSSNDAIQRQVASLQRRSDPGRALFELPRFRRLRSWVAAVADSHVAPRVADMEVRKSVEERLPRALARKGWLGVTIDKTYSGMACGHRGKSIMLEELARVSAATAAATQASQLGAAMIIYFGDAEQKQRWLPSVASGHCLPTIAVTEPGSGSHVLGMSTTATREGDAYVLNGVKTYVGNSHIGTVHGVVARTGAGPRGLSAFLVERDTPGLEVPPHEPALGLHGFSFGQLRFTDCRVPVRHRLGVEGEGLAVAYASSVLYGRANLAAVALGIHQAIVERTVLFAVQRSRYGKALSELPSIKLKVGAMKSRLMTARLCLYAAVDMLDAGLPCDAELMNAKLVNAESCLDSARQAMEIHAAAGLRTSHEVERHLRDAHHIYAPAGTSDIQLLRLGEFALGQTKQEWSKLFARAVEMSSLLALLAAVRIGVSYAKLRDCHWLWWCAAHPALYRSLTRPTSVWVDVARQARSQ